MISEVYGGGGNSGAPYTNDFVELYNPTGSSVSLVGYAVQYASATGTSWTVTNLSGSIPAGGRYLVQLDTAGAAGSALPSPDVVGTINLSATAGKIALTNTQTALTGTGISGASVVDFVGYGSTASASEGGAPAPAGTNTTSVARNASGTDSNNNANDFTAGPPSPVGTGVDNLAPSVLTLSPADNATTATTTQNLVITFSEPVIKGTGNITVKLSTGGTTAETIDPVNDLLANTAYYINIPNTAFKDAANNFYVGITNTSSWNFSIPAPAGTLATSGSFNISNNDTVYAFQGGASTPAQFLAVVISNETTDSVANTGLTASNIVVLTSTTDHYQYTGTRSGQPSFSAAAGPAAPSPTTTFLGPPLTALPVASTVTPTTTACKT